MVLTTSNQEAMLSVCAVPLACDAVGKRLWTVLFKRELIVQPVHIFIFLSFSKAF